MLTHDDAFAGFSVNDVEAAKRFYGETLGLPVSVNDMGILDIRLPRGTVIAYPKPNHEPATFTILNFAVPSVETAVQELEAAGVTMIRYEGMNQDERGIARGMGPAIAWFNDPAGNILAVLEAAPHD